MIASYKYKSETYTKVYSIDYCTKAALDLLRSKSCIGEFKYTTVDIQILSSILTNITGQSRIDFATYNLFQPLEIKSPNSVFLQNKEERFSSIKDKHVSEWEIYLK